jgi:hypothetical protein
MAAITRRPMTSLKGDRPALSQPLAIGASLAHPDAHMLAQNEIVRTRRRTMSPARTLIP